MKFHENLSSGNCVVLCDQKAWYDNAGINFAQRCCKRDYKNKMIPRMGNYVTYWNCTGSTLISSSINLLGLDAMMVWPNFVAGSHQRLVYQKLLCGLNYSTLNIFLWKPALRKLRMAEWEEAFYSVIFLSSWC